MAETLTYGWPTASIVRAKCRRAERAIRLEVLRNGSKPEYLWDLREVQSEATIQCAEAGDKVAQKSLMRVCNRH